MRVGTAFCCAFLIGFVVCPDNINPPPDTNKRGKTGQLITGGFKWLARKEGVQKILNSKAMQQGKYYAGMVGDKFADATAKFRTNSGSGRDGYETQDDGNGQNRGRSHHRRQNSDRERSDSDLERSRSQVDRSPSQLDRSPSQIAAQSHPPSYYHGPCVQYCANTYGFVFASGSIDGQLRFSDGVVFPITRGKINPLSRWRSIKDWRKTGEYESRTIPYKCDCHSTEEFKKLMEDNPASLKAFENLQRTAPKEASDLAITILRKQNEKLPEEAPDKYFYADHRSLIAMILAEMTTNSEDPERAKALADIQRKAQAELRRRPQDERALHVDVPL